MEDPEIIFCKVPFDKDCALYIKFISWNETPEKLWFYLSEILSEFGLLYNVYIAHSKFRKASSGCFYAFARYYSKNAATRALLNEHKIQIDLDSPNLKISKLPQNNQGIRKLKLCSSAILELLTYYFGFDCCSSDILYIEKVKEEACVLKYVSKVCFTTKEGLYTEGIGEASVTSNGPEGRGKTHKLAQKCAIENARAMALSKFVIVILSNGKRILEVDTTVPDYSSIDPCRGPSILAIGELENDPDEIPEESGLIEDLSDSALESLLDI